MKDWWNDARRNPYFRLTALLGVFAIALDQASKLWILHGLRWPEIAGQASDGPSRGAHIDLTPFFDLTYSENTGVSFGLFSGGMMPRVIFTVLAIAVTGFILHWAGRLDRKVAAIGAGLIAGGAIGNAIDRAFYGFVVDFLDFSGLFFPWIFNVADVCISLGVACLAYDAFVVAPRLEQAPKTVAAPTARLKNDDENDRPSKLTETKES